MAQTAFTFDSTGTLPAQASPAARGRQAHPAPADGTLEATGFDIGWALAHHKLTPPVAHLHADNPVRQGWQAGRAAFGERTLKASPTVRQWLALRLDAWRDGQAFEEVQVTPNFLAQLATAECPVSRLPLDPQADDGVVMRLNPTAAYAAGNLVLVHRSVAQARQALDVTEMLAIAQRIASGECTAVRGLDAAAWQRLAVLASFASPVPAAQAACLPLVVLPANRLRVIHPLQALQVMLTLQFSAAGYARRLLGLAALLPQDDARQAFQIFMHTLLARRLAVSPQATPGELRRAIEDSWLDPLVQRRWQRLALRLSAAQAELWLKRAAQRGLVVGGGRWISAESATEGWALPATPAAVRAAQAARLAAAPWARPGSARNLGSQKLAS